MNGTEIKAEIRQKGYTLALIAETLKTNPPAVSGVINRHTTSKRIASAICKILDKPLSEVFPDVPTYVDPANERNKANKEAKRQELETLLAS
ncbi:hypothetical protein tloyanaT_25990 [Thalassotalea loyana]|uniref:Ner winged helix-turn-helix DNA-binding domain-containing protein n=1 Tax=Thalassotalea loyana TaxID=280483 RepID=A0ABQ6HIC0_9GAMM|nr:helix-turn-helix domain-containing protein [Thalassotalea loyana]GLX86346.1 hypothetical protein tloyanaT_25990 [Thalassotalea loyana]